MEGKSSAFLALLESGEYSDFTIVCQTVEFKVHRAIVCSQSTMLQKAASGGFKEAEEARMTLTEEDPAIFSRVLVFLYTDDYDATMVPAFAPSYLPMLPHPDIDAAKIDNPIALLEIHTLVYKYADMLGIETLKKLASKMFLDLFEKHCASPDFAKPLNLMYESTNTGDTILRLPVTKTCISKYKDIIKCNVRYGSYPGSRGRRVECCRATTAKTGGNGRNEKSNQTTRCRSSQSVRLLCIA